LAAAITAGSALGETMIWAPAAAAATTCAALSTVPAPTSNWPSKRARDGGDAGQGPRRTKGHLDAADAAIAHGGGDLHRLVRRHPAQHRHQGQAGENITPGDSHLSRRGR